MKHTHRSAMTLLLAAALLLSGCAGKEPASAPGADTTSSSESSNSSSSSSSSSSESSLSSPESETSSQSTSSVTPFDPADDPLFLSTQKYLDLKGEELIAKFGWPYDVPISTEGMTVKKILMTDRDIYEDFPLSELSNRIRWHTICDYGCLAMTPENGGKYEYKKYKAGDKIGELTVSKIRTLFKNIEYYSEDLMYFGGLDA